MWPRRYSSAKPISASVSKFVGKINANGSKALANRFLVSPLFESFIGVVIVANSVTIGLEQTRRLKNLDTTDVDMVEHIFLSIYIAELLFRMYAKGLACF